MAYGINAKNLRVADLFITKYEASDSQSNYLDGHTDKTPWSFVIPLNDGFEGGGTLFYRLNEVWKPDEVGSALIFHGKHMHGGDLTI